MNTLFAQSFLSAVGILALFGIIVVLCVVIISSYRRAIIYNRLSGSSMRSALLVGFSWRAFILKKLLLAIAGIMLGLAFLQPRWGSKSEQVRQEVRELFIALDVSRSMLAQDIQPSRLEMAKQKISNLINRLQSERIGLILFAGNAIVQCPLTTDWSAFNLF